MCPVAGRDFLEVPTSSSGATLSGPGALSRQFAREMESEPNCSNLLALASASRCAQELPLAAEVVSHGNTARTVKLWGVHVETKAENSPRLSSVCSLSMRV